MKKKIIYSSRIKVTVIQSITKSHSDFIDTYIIEYKFLWLKLHRIKQVVPIPKVSVNDWMGFQSALDNKREIKSIAKAEKNRLRYKLIGILNDVEN